MAETPSPTQLLTSRATWSHMNGASQRHILKIISRHQLRPHRLSTVGAGCPAPLVWSVRTTHSVAITCIQSNDPLRQHGAAEMVVMGLAALLVLQGLRA